MSENSVGEKNVEILLINKLLWSVREMETAGDGMLQSTKFQKCNNLWLILNKIPIQHVCVQ